MKHRKSLRSQLIALLCAASITPLLIVQFISYQNTTDIIRENAQELMTQNQAQSIKMLGEVLGAYEDLLYQLYTDDDIVSLVDKLAAGVDTAISKNQLSRMLRAQVYVKPYIQSIAVMLADGTNVFYDKLTGHNTRSSWMDTWGDVQGEILKPILDDNRTHVLPSRFAIQVSGENHTLFHLAHRLIDYRNIEKRNAIVVLSLDEALLTSVCNPEWQQGANAVNLLMDAQGWIVSAPVPELLGLQLKGEAEQACRMLLTDYGLIGDKHLFSSSLRDDYTGWTLVHIADMSEIYDRMTAQQLLILLGLILAVAAITAAVIVLIRHLTRSVGTVVNVMRQAGAGNMDARVPESAGMPTEIAIISDQFNGMMAEMNRLMSQREEEAKRRREAEIAALEAQINPHFLYNTLDTINWMAIDCDQYEISNAISAFARILRYGISGSNHVSTIKEETEWLRQYIFFQQLRLKSAFEWMLAVEPEALHLPVQKLLFQPFIENAILHGFEGSARSHRLDVSIMLAEGGLCIVISDNGRGMSEAELEALMGNIQQGLTPAGIGVANAVGRMRMYYGGDVDVKVKSSLGEGTTVTIVLPLKGVNA